MFKSGVRSPRKDIADRSNLLNSAHPLEFFWFYDIEDNFIFNMDVAVHRVTEYNFLF